MKSSRDQEFRQYRLLKDSRVHLFEFNQVDTTMRIADEFEHKDAYTRPLASMERSNRQHYGAILAFQADLQTAGRGQHTRNWSSPKADNCYITFLMQLKNQPFYAPLVAALAVTEALNSFLPAKEGFKIKWINDVHYEN